MRLQKLLYLKLGLRFHQGAETSPSQGEEAVSERAVDWTSAMIAATAKADVVTVLLGFDGSPWWLPFLEKSEPALVWGGTAKPGRIPVLPAPSSFSSKHTLLFLLFYISLFKKNYWSIPDSQCCINFCCTAKWFSYTYMYILFHLLFHCGLSMNTEYSSLCYTVGPPCSSISLLHSMQTNQITVFCQVLPWPPYRCLGGSFLNICIFF